MTKKEKVYKQIFNDIEADLSNSQLRWGSHKLEFTRLDIGMNQNEILTNEMVFEEGLIPKLWTNSLLLLFLLFTLLMGKDYTAFYMFLVIVTLGILYNLLHKTSRNKIIISKFGIKFDSTDEIFWSQILDTYMKEVPFGKSTKHYYVISLQDETVIEQEISMYWGSRYCNIAHYTEMYKKKYLSNVQC